MKQIILIGASALMIFAAAIGLVIGQHAKKDKVEEAADRMEKRSGQITIETANWPTYSICKEIFPNAKCKWLGQPDVEERDIDISQVKADIVFYASTVTLTSKAPKDAVDICENFDYHDISQECVMFPLPDPLIIEQEWLSISNTRAMIDTILTTCEEKTYVDGDRLDALYERLDALETQLLSFDDSCQRNFVNMKCYPVFADYDIPYYAATVETMEPDAENTSYQAYIDSSSACFTSDPSTPGVYLNSTTCLDEYTANNITYIDLLSSIVDILYGGCSNVL